MEKSKRVYRIRLIQIGAFIGLLSLLLLILVYVHNMLLSFVLAIILSYLLEPIVDSFERIGLKRFYSILAVFFIVGIILLAGVFALKPFVLKQFINFQSEWSGYVAGFNSLVERGFKKLELVSEIEVFKTLLEKIETTFSYWATSLFKDFPTFLSKSLATFFLAPFFAFFLLSDGRLASRKFLTLIPNSMFELVLNVYYQIHLQMGQFIRARLLEAFIVGLLVFAGLYLFEFRYAVILSSFAVLTNLIPYIGPVIGFIPALVLALLSEQVQYDVIVVLSVYSIAQLVDSVLLIPLIVAKIVNLHPVSVVVVIIIGAQLMGILGMFISIPVTCMLKVILSTFYKHSVGSKI